MEMNFCRRCGSPLTLNEGHIYTCENGHTIFGNAAPASCLWVVNDKNEVLVAVRERDPGIGLLDAPGGFNDGAETTEHALAREMEEEVGLKPTDYTEPQFLMTALDSYEYAGEKIDVLSNTYWARLIGNPTITPQDDVAEATFMAIEDISPDKIYFDAVRKSFLKLRDTLTK
jgi:ADP-ribose pyrophosphatase YjhB (NUDIX family)